MVVNTLKFKDPDFPAELKNIPNPPKQIHTLGFDRELYGSTVWVAVIGSRKVSPYGTHATKKIVKELAGYGIGIVSGLALGVDGLSHMAALDAGGKTIAVLPCGLDTIYPSTHRPLARRILENGGALITEYHNGTEPFQSNFLQRNRLISGLSRAVLVTEAAQRSGSLNTASHAIEQGRTVMAVPGNITSLLSTGTNNLIKSGAVPITEANDVLSALNFSPLKAKQKEVIAANKEEQAVLSLLKEGVTDGGELLKRSELEASLFNQTLTMLEITGRIKPLGAGRWVLS